jgi:hypothetical protein
VREDGQVLIKTTLVGIGSRLHDGQYFSYYSIDPMAGDPDELGYGTVRGTEADKADWRAAATEYMDVIATANTELWRVLYRGRWRHYLPGGRRRVQLAKRAYHDRTQAARLAYQPVLDEIRRRHTAEEDELRRQYLEEQRVRDAELAEVRAQERRYRSLADEAVWGWIVTPADSVWVFRYDLAPPEVSDRKARRSDKPRTAFELEEDLWELEESGISKVEWDRAARLEAARAAAPPEAESATDVDFHLWWVAVTRRIWYDPGTIPAPRPPRPPAHAERVVGRDVRPG